MLDDAMGVDSWKGELPFLPHMGDTLVLNSRNYVVTKVAWLLQGDDNPETSISIAATNR